MGLHVNFPLANFALKTGLITFGHCFQVKMMLVKMEWYKSRSAVLESIIYIEY